MPDLIASNALLRNKPRGIVLWLFVIAWGLTLVESECSLHVALSLN